MVEMAASGPAVSRQCATRRRGLLTAHDSSDAVACLQPTTSVHRDLSKPHASVLLWTAFAHTALKHTALFAAFAFRAGEVEAQAL